MPELRIMSSRGDDRVTWKRGDRAGEEKARAAFEEARHKGLLAFTVDDSAHGSQIRDFDPKADVTVLMPPLQGG